MTDLFKRAVEATRDLPDEVQDEIARMMLQLAGESGPIYLLSDEEKAGMAKSLAQARRREFASDEEVSAIWTEFGL